ncbi:MAG TPA: transposase [Dysgonamonadaceae bacterium]|nr:transposase [Dysgonamonadaceae bacterium]
MFKESDKNAQLDIFSTPAEHLRGSSQKFYLKDDSWHNVFRDNVLSHINEQIFSVLYCQDNGTPNASIRVLVGMMLLKEGQGWSDDQLFENCNYNLLVRSALGLLTLDDTVPVASTYYRFRRNIVDYNREHNVDLFKECMQSITKRQIVEFNVSGKHIRMDSKLMGSNIAWYSRYELVHETLRLFIKERRGYIYKRSLSKNDLELIKSIEGESGDKVVYYSTKSEIGSRFLALGNLMYLFIRLFKNYPGGQYDILKTVFNEQYSCKEKVVLALENEQLSTSSIQSPHDPESHFRNKGGNKVKGNSINVTETCDESTEADPKVNLITDIDVKPATASDCGFMQDATDNSQRITTDAIEKVYADGAYNSPKNQEFCDDNDINFILTGLQGPKGRYDLIPDKQNSDKLTVKDNKTGNIIDALLVKSTKKPEEKKWKIKTDNGKWRYFTLEEIRTSLLRQKLRDTPKEELNRRNNVEATIFQMGFHYSNNKSRYRGLAKHKLWAYSRALWVNFVRLQKYAAKLRESVSVYAQNSILSFKIIITEQIITKISNQNYKTNKSLKRSQISFI